MLSTACTRRPPPSRSAAPADASSPPPLPRPILSPRMSERAEATIELTLAAHTPSDVVVSVRSLDDRRGGVGRVHRRRPNRPPHGRVVAAVGPSRPGCAITPTSARHRSGDLRRGDRRGHAGAPCVGNGRRRNGRVFGDRADGRDRGRTGRLRTGAAARSRRSHGDDRRQLRLRERTDDGRGVHRGRNRRRGVGRRSEPRSLHRSRHAGGCRP